MTKKRYKIKANGNIKDSLRVGKIKVSCVSDKMEPFDKTIKITQLKADKNLYCRPAFYNKLENLPKDGTIIKMSIIYKNAVPKIECSNWIKFTKVSTTDIYDPIQYFVEIEPNTGRSRIGQIKISFDYEDVTYSESYTITQYGNEINNAQESIIECNPNNILNVSTNDNIITINVNYINIKTIKEPIFSPYNASWINIQEINEIKSDEYITKIYNIIIQKNEDAGGRDINLIFNGLGDNGKEIFTNCQIHQLGTLD